MSQTYAGKPHIFELHGEKIVDPYHWLRDPNWQELSEEPELLQADIRAFLENENKHTEQVLAPTAALQQQLYDEMLGRIQEDDSSVPLPHGDWEYFSQTQSGKQYRRYLRRPRGGGEEQLLLDANALSQGHAYLSLAAVDHSPDHRWLAVAADTTGAERYTLQVQAIEHDERSALVLENTNGDLVWAADSKTLYYTTLDDDLRPDAVWRVNIEDCQPECVFREDDPGFFVSVGETRSGRFIVINASDHETDEQWVLESADPSSKPRCIAKREIGVQYDIEDYKDSWIILNNRDGVLDFKLQLADIGKDEPANWRDWYLPASGVLLEDYMLFAGHLVVEELSDALPRIGIMRLDLMHVLEQQVPSFNYITFDEPCYALETGDSYEFDTSELRFHYESPTTPSELWSMDMGTAERQLLKRQAIPSGHNPSDYVSERGFALAADGENIPVSLLYSRAKGKAGCPCLLQGYGAYGSSSPAGFSIVQLSLVDRGFVMVTAHVRGGMEKGYQWYLDGKLENKTNTFDDFIAVAENLVQQHGISAEGLCCYGGSAGGMLIGAVLNKRPELFAAAVADVPFVDVLATMCDDSLPLTPIEWPEWGNPIKDKTAFDRIRDYSPVDNVAPVQYPHLLVLAGLSDPRVTYWEPAKWVAKMRDTAKQDNHLLLKTNMEAGHGGASGRYDALRETAVIYAFLLLGIGDV